jgi:hypothetical protein
MDVDATHTRDEFLRRMHGKCFGCGSAVHARKDGNHERDQCNYCKRVGHREVVCMEKFMGKPKGQKAAATDQGEEVGTSTPDEGSGEPEGEGLAATTAITLAQLVEQQKALAEQIAALHEQDF